MSTPAEIAARIILIKAQIALITVQLTALVTGNVKQYELDTGQSRQSLQKLSIKDLRWLQNDLQKELLALENSIGQVATIMEPSW